MAGLKEIPIIIKRGLNDKERFERQLVENLQYERLPILEKAEAIQKLKKIKGLSNEEIGEKLGLSKMHIGRILKLNNLPEKMRNVFLEGKISATDLMEIRSLPENEQMSALADYLSKTEQKEEARSLFKKGKIHKRPKDYLRQMGVDVDSINLNSLVLSSDENMMHFIVKAIIFKLLREAERDVGCEMEIGDGVADVVDLKGKYVYEVETNPSEDRVKKKLEQFGNAITDMIIIDTNRLNISVEDAVWKLKNKIVT